MIETLPNDLAICIKDFLDNYDTDYPDTDNIMNISSEDYKIFIRIRLESKAESVIMYLSGNNFIYETDKIFDVIVLPYGYILDKYHSHSEGPIPDDETDRIENEITDKISLSIRNYISDTEKIVNSEIKFKKPFKNILSSKDEEIIDPKILVNVKSELEEFEENKKVFNISILPKELPDSLARLIKVYDKIQVTFNIYNNFLDLDLPIDLFIEKNKNLANIEYVYTYIARRVYCEDGNQMTHSIKKNYIFDCDIPNCDVSTAMGVKNSKDTLLKGLYSAVDACVSYMKKVGNGKITYKIFVYRRTEL
mgnify:CR=1 FL=1